MPRRGPMGPPWWRHWLRNCGCRITTPREIILDVLSRAPGHFSADEIFFMVKQMYPQIGLATIYRTLELLSNMGLVHKLDFGEGKARYELAQGPETKGHHHHLICLRCHKVIDYEEISEKEKELLKEVEENLEKKYDFKITDHFFNFYGICKDCQNKVDETK
ncbi:transcriptional repressor [bacterium]|nr:transcriptional repressor [bacterium]